MNKQLNIPKCRGTTMIEVLVTIIVMSIGLLGIAGMQTIGLASNTAAYNRSQATILAYGIADRARANVLGKTSYNNTSTDSSIVEKASCKTTTGCSAADMAINDIWEWHQTLAASLPAGYGSICIDSTPNTVNCDGAGDIYVIRVFWDEDKAGTFKEFTTDFKI